MIRGLAVALLGFLSIADIASAGEHRRRDGRDRSYSYNEMRDRRDRARYADQYRYDRYRNERYRNERSRDDYYGDDRRRDDTRSTAASVGIIAGSAGAGAAIGGIAKGGKGAAIGAIAGGIAGTVYDQATRDNDNDRYRRRR